MSGMMYQLYSSRQMSVGEEFYVNGPYDQWGFVIKSEPAKMPVEGTDTQKWLNLIRGTGSQRPNHESY